MKLRVGSWNIEGRLSNGELNKRGRPNQIFEGIKNLDVDILVLPEAHSENSIDNLIYREQLIDMGYNLRSVAYQDDMASRKDAYANQLSIMLLSKLPIEKFEIIRLADFRNAFVATIIDSPSNKKFRVIGLHLDDRSELTRLSQVTDLLKIINQSDLPTVVLGDFNAMHGDDFWPARFLRLKLVRFLAKFILPVISLRAIEMARGETLRLLQSDIGLCDADTKHRPTTTPKMRRIEWMPSIRLIQIDHIFVTSDIKVKDFQINPDEGADHRAIIATLDI